MLTLRHALVVVCVAGSIFLHAADEPKKEGRSVQQLKPDRLVSENSFFYVYTPDLKKTRAAFERTAFRALLREDEVATPLLNTYARMRDAYVKGDGVRTDMELRRRNDEVDLLMKIAPLFEGQVALSIEGGANAFESIGKGETPPFLFVGSIPAGEEGEKRQRELEGIMEKYRYNQGTDPHFKETDDRIGSYDFVRIECSDLNLVESWAFVENLFIYGQGKKVVEDALERLQKNSAGALVRHAGYQGAFEQVGHDNNGDSLVYLQMDMRPLVQALGNMYPVFRMMEPAEALRPHLALGMQVGDGDNAAVKEKIFFRANKDDMPKSSGACSGITARFATNDILYYGAEQISIADSLRAAIERNKKAEGEKKEQSLTDKLKAMMAAQNEAEIISKLDLFKGEMAIFFSYVPQPTLKFDNVSDYLEVLQPVFVVELDKDNAGADGALKNLLGTLIKNAGQEYVPTVAGNATIYYQKGASVREERANASPIGLFGNLLSTEKEASATPFFAAYARVDIDVEPGRQRKFLLLSDSLNAIKKAVQQSQPDNLRASLAEDKRFKELLHDFRETRRTISYVDLLKVVDVYGKEIPRLTKTALLSRDATEHMPSPQVLKEHLYPMAWASSVVPEPEGVLFEVSSPTGNVTMFSLIGSVAWPAIIAQRQKAISDEIDTKFKKIMLGLHLYAADFDRFPIQLSDIHRYVKDDLSLFESPFKRGAIKQVQDIDNSELTNLVYVPRSLQDLGSDILIYEKEPTKVVVTGDGIKLYYHVIRLGGARLEKDWYMTRAQLERYLEGKLELVTSNLDSRTDPKKGNQRGPVRSAPPPKRK